MIGMFLAAVALQSTPYEAINPTIPYSQCMTGGLSARLSGDAEIEAAKRIAAFEQTLAECAAVRASALAKLDLMLSGMASGQTRPGPRIDGKTMMDIWDKTFRRSALDPGFRWHGDATGKPAK